MVNSKISGGCWTCRGTPSGALLTLALELTSPERKIRCDRQIPFCQNCFQSKRQCQGYSIRLSWPQQDDQRRAVCAKNPLTLGNSVRLLSGNKVQFLNVFVSDLRLYNDICGDDTLCKIAHKFCSTYLSKVYSWLPNSGSFIRKFLFLFGVPEDSEGTLLDSFLAGRAQSNLTILLYIVRQTGIYL